MVDNETSNNTKSQLSNSTYDALKNLVILWLPGAGALYFSLSQVWEFPSVEQVVGVIALITVFFGTILRISSTRYANSDAPYNGQMVVTENVDGRKIFSLELTDSPEALEEKNSVAFRVVNG
jgi:hypothetical protein